jgi:hypothetical protein
MFFFTGDSKFFKHLLYRLKTNIQFFGKLP